MEELNNPQLREALRAALRGNFLQRITEFDKSMDAVLSWQWPAEASTKRLAQPKVSSAFRVLRKGADSFLELAESFLDDSYAPNRPGTAGDKFLNYYLPLMWFSTPDWEIGASYFRYRADGNSAKFLGAVKGFMIRHSWLLNCQLSFAKKPSHNLWHAFSSLGLDSVDHACTNLNLMVDLNCVPRDQRFGTLYQVVASLASFGGPDYPMLTRPVKDSWFNLIRCAVAAILAHDSEALSQSLGDLYKAHRRKHNIPWDAHTAFPDVSLIATFLERIARGRNVEYEPPKADCRDEVLILSSIGEPHSDFCFLPGGHLMLEPYESSQSWLTALVGEAVSVTTEHRLYAT